MLISINGNLEGINLEFIDKLFIFKNFNVKDFTIYLNFYFIKNVYVSFNT